MDKEKFRRHLEEATKHLIVFTKTLCFNDFADNYKYLITPNLRTVGKDDEHLNDKEISVLATWNKYENKLLTGEQVVELFHHDNKVPVPIFRENTEMQRKQRRFYFSLRTHFLCELCVIPMHRD